MVLCGLWNYRDKDVVAECNRISAGGETCSWAVPSSEQMPEEGYLLEPELRHNQCTALRPLTELLWALSAGECESTRALGNTEQKQRRKQRHCLGGRANALTCTTLSMFAKSKIRLNHS